MEVLAGSHGSSGQVWIENHPTLGWTPGRVDSLGSNGNYNVVDESGGKFEIPQEKARPVDQASLRGVDDLLSLGDFNEGSLLHTIRERYFKDEIYTGIGNPILISVNPYATFSGLYSEAKQKYYRERGAEVSSGSDVKIPPHLFSVADGAYVAMLGDGKNQSIIISGESGAGKTEATKRILTYFANIQSSSGGVKDNYSLEQQVLRANPILESFGNAKTIRNDNSSRFGKFIEIEFDVGKLHSAQISNYLLEKCRIVKQQPGERGYHVFYQLCASAGSMDISSALHLDDPSQHLYISGCTLIPDVNDRRDFQEVMDCMTSLGFSLDERNAIFKIVAAVLHLGDMEFTEHADSANGCKALDPTKAGWICQLLNVRDEDFTKVFQFKTLEDPFTKKIIDMPQDVSGATNVQHSMAKVCYSRLFDWLVWRINRSTMAKGADRAKECRTIGILDIYGFEVFDWNSFEQLCINFANEKLQQHFNSHMFTLEQRLYTEEGISWSHIEWQDNREIIESLERKPLGLFCILDSECLMPNATDNSCLSKVHNSFKNSKIVFKPSRFASTNFSVSHYAGEVIYDIISFLEKNTDKLHADIINLLKSSSLPLLKTLFSDPRFAPESGTAGTRSSGATGGADPSKRRSMGGPDNPRAKQNVTVSMMFRQQLDQLVDDLNKTNPRYIRCIKPNGNKQARDFDSLDVRRQLRCAGMLESIRIRRAGYSVRHPFRDFFHRFRILCPHISTAGKIDPDFKELCRRILTEMEAKFVQEKTPIPAKSWQVGRSKVFLKEELQEQFEKRCREGYKSHVLRMQKVWRGYKQRRRYRAMRVSALALQAGLRMLRAVTEFRAAQKRRQACILVQAFLRMRAQQRTHICRRAAAITVQRMVRGWRCRTRLGKLKGKLAAEKVQRMRDEEDRKAALASANAAAKLAAEEKERALEELQTQRSRDEEAQRKREETILEEERQRGRRDQEQAASQAEQLRQEMLDLRKENARLQGQLECGGVSKSASGVSEVEIDHFRRELQDLRREKARLEVELATAKSSSEYEAVNAEAQRLREECSVLRRSKLDADLQLEQREAQIDALQSQASRGQVIAGELGAIRDAHEEVQVQLQRALAQKAALEERLQAEEEVRSQLRNLSLERLRLEGEVETARMREEAMGEKMKASEKMSAELQQQRQRVVAQEAELDATRKHVEGLRAQVSEMSKNSIASRTESLDLLRTELLSRIDSKPVQAQSGSATQPPAVPPSDITDTSGGASTDGERKTLLNQRALFEQIKQQFSDAKDAPQAGHVAVGEEVHSTDQQRLTELEEDLRQARKDNVELNIRITSLQDELQEHGCQTSQLLQSTSVLQAELQDSKFLQEQESAALKRQMADMVDAQARLREAEGEAGTLRKRLLAAEERLVRAEEDCKAAQGRAARLDEERKSIEHHTHELQRQAVDATARERTASSQLEEVRNLAERYKMSADGAERARVESESSARWLASEHERLKTELADTQQEKAKIKQVVEELMQADTKNRNDDLEREVDRWKAKAANFEREYNQSKQLNAEMTRVMSQMTQAVSERSDASGDAARQNRVLTKQLEAKAQEARSARHEKDEIQKQLDCLQATGTYYQEKYKEISNELRTLKQEHSVSAASSSKLKVRVESLQKENEDLKAQCGKLAHDMRACGDGTGRVERYEQHVRDLQQKLVRKEEAVTQSEACYAKSQQVNDCLNTLLALETDQKDLYEKTFAVQDETVRTQLEAKKSKASHVIHRLNEIMNQRDDDDEPVARPAPATLTMQPPAPATTTVHQPDLTFLPPGRR